MRSKSILSIFMCALLICSCTILSKEQKLDVAMKVVKLSRNQQEIEIQEGERLSRFDKFAVKVTAQRDTYVYIFRIDTNQKRTQLFPTNLNEINFLKSDEELRVPDSEKWIELGEKAGLEEIFVLSNKYPLANPDKVFEHEVKRFKGPAEETKGLGSPPKDDRKIVRFPFKVGSVAEETKGLTPPTKGR